MYSRHFYEIPYQKKIFKFFYKMKIFNLKVSVKVLGTFSQIEYSKEWGRRVGQVERIEENHVKDTSVIYLKSQEELRKLP